jgi:hypothetical protein
MEALQMLKFGLRQDRLDFTSGWMATEDDMLRQDIGEDLLAGLLDSANREAGIETIMQVLAQDDEDLD